MQLECHRTGSPRAALAFVLSVGTLCCALALEAAQTLSIGGGRVSDTTSARQHVLDIVDGSASPQVLFKFSLPAQGEGEEAFADILLSTCPPEGTAPEAWPSFQAVIYIVELEKAERAISRSATIEPLFKSETDCQSHASLSARIRTGVDFVAIVTSAAAYSGRFDLESKLLASPPTPTPLPWGLDRIDQRKLPLDNEYSVDGLSGAPVVVYVLDSGIRTSHEEFEGRAQHGIDTISRKPFAFDCVGHGTHVAGVIGGKSFGVAKGSVLINVRVLGCSGKGFTTSLIEGLEFVLQDYNRRRSSPAVVSMSLNLPKSEAINELVRSVIDTGLPVVTAAGNIDQDSCSFSPASERRTITVAASQPDDTRPVFSNSGRCVDMFAPGEGVLSAWHTGDHAARVLSGTSQACPHVTGAVAVLLSANPKLPPDAVSNMIYSAATFSAVANHTAAVYQNGTTNEEHEENNRLLYVRPIPSFSATDRPPKGNVFIYSILTIGLSGASAVSEIDRLCNAWLDQSRIRLMQSIFGEASDVGTQPGSVEVWTCCPLNFNRTHCSDRRNASTLTVRLRQKERLVARSFSRFGAYLENLDNIAYLKEVVAHRDPLLVSVEPWIVDSDGNVFWAAPDLRGPSSEGLTLWSKIAIAVCSAAVAILWCVLTCVLLRRRGENRRAHEEEVAKAEYEQMKREQTAVQRLDALHSVESPREQVPRKNTALEGEILANLPSTASLRTPMSRMFNRDDNTGRNKYSTTSTARGLRTFTRLPSFFGKPDAAQGPGQVPNQGNLQASDQPGQDAIANTPAIRAQGGSVFTRRMRLRSLNLGTDGSAAMRSSSIGRRCDPVSSETQPDQPTEGSQAKDGSTNRDIEGGNENHRNDVDRSESNKSNKPPRDAPE